MLWLSRCLVGLCWGGRGSTAKSSDICDPKIFHPFGAHHQRPVFGSKSLLPVVSDKLDMTSRHRIASRAENADAVRSQREWESSDTSVNS